MLGDLWVMPSKAKNMQCWGSSLGSMHVLTFTVSLLICFFIMNCNSWYSGGAEPRLALFETWSGLIMLGYQYHTWHCSGEKESDT